MTSGYLVFRAGAHRPIAQALPTFLPEPHARDAAVWWTGLYGLPRPRWALREHIDARFIAAAKAGRPPRLTVPMQREWWGWVGLPKAEPWVRAVRFVRHPLRRRLKAWERRHRREVN